MNSQREKTFEVTKNRFQEALRKIKLAYRNDGRNVPEVSEAIALLEQVSSEFQVDPLLNEIEPIPGQVRQQNNPAFRDASYPAQNPQNHPADRNQPNAPNQLEGHAKDLDTNTERKNPQLHGSATPAKVK